MRKLKCFGLLLGFMALANYTHAQTTVSTGSQRNTLLEAVLSTRLGLSPNAYCIQDSLRANSRFIPVNYHSNWGSLNDTLHNTSSANFINNFGITGIPTGIFDREAFLGNNLAVGTQDWVSVFSAAIQAGSFYQLTMTVYRNGQQVRVFLQGKALAALSGPFLFNAFILEDSINYSQANNFTSGSCSYLSAGNPIVNFKQRDVMRDALGGLWGTLASNNPAANQVDTMSYYFTVPAHYNMNRLKIVGIIQKGAPGDHRTYNCISLKMSDVCQSQITGQPSAQQVNDGGNAQFSVSTSNTGSSFQWQVGSGTSFQNLSNGGIYSGVTSSTLSINNVTLAQSGLQFRCVASNGTCTDTSSSAMLTVLCAPQIALQPGNKQSITGSSVLFNIASSNASSSRQWQSNTGSGFINLSNAGQYSGVNTDTLNVSNLSLSNNSQLFRCILHSNGCYDTSSTALLSVSCAPQINTQPANGSAATGNTATFSVTPVNGSSTIQWQSDQGTGFVNLSNAGQYSGVNTNTLSISNVSLSNHNQVFRCILSNSNCTDTSASAELTVSCAAQISTEPVNTSVNAGSTAQFTVTAVNGASTYQWYSDAGLGFQPLSNAGQYSGANSATLSINNTTLSNNNQLFRCLVTFSSCADSSNTVKLTVNNPNGIAQSFDKNSVSLYPNPADEQLVMSTNNSSLYDAPFYIFDLSGRIILSGKLQQGKLEIPVGHWQNGLYMLQVLNASQRFQVLHR